MLTSKGRAGAIKALLKRGARHAATDDFGWTALHLAAVGGHLDAVKALLRGGAQTRAIDKEDRTPAELAEGKGFEMVLKLLRNA